MSLAFSRASQPQRKCPLTALKVEKGPYHLYFARNWTINDQTGLTPNDA